MTTTQPARAQQASGGPPKLEVNAITKLFPGVVANKDIDLALHEGEILALLGENGAGKSTLMNIIYGLYQPSEGQILVDGRTVELHSPRDAIDLGIGMVHQHFQLVPVMSVVDNIMLGSESVDRGLLDRESVSAQIQELAERYNMPVDPNAIIEDLPVGVQQRVDILKALYRNAEFLIVDEPT
ncbi:MAG: ATP-binding cassette domain-containing protein, partial [Caldilineaceae bacterium SB0675_bin_29]|nr:ATP-binding cassette domain-containing protein [Caldilineaceae bacterium SB0675_bin_29]